MNTLVVEFVTVRCGSCGTVFGLERVHYEHLVREGGDFHCPNGHSRTYSKALKRREEMLERQLAAERARHDQTRTAKEAAERQAAAARGEVTKIKNRIGNGVCPCCKRMFQDLHRHMAAKHPDFAGATGEPMRKATAQSDKKAKKS